MSDEKPFCIDRPKATRATCKKCKDKCLKGELRIGKLGPNPFGEGKMKVWYHVHCMFEQFLTQRVTTIRIESPDDIDGWDNLSSEDQDELLKKIEENRKDYAQKHGQSYSPMKVNNAPSTSTSVKKDSSRNSNKISDIPSTSTSFIKDPVNPSTNGEQFNVSSAKDKEKLSKDLYFREFRKVVTDIFNADGYIEKTNIVKNLFAKGREGTGFKGNIYLWCRLLLPGVVQRTYNIKNKQLIKLFSKLFKVSSEAMTYCLNRGDIGETIQQFFEKNDAVKPSTKSTLLLQEVDDFLQRLTQLSKEEDQLEHFKSILPKCTGNDLKVIIRLVRHDLRMNAGAKHILQALHPGAYQAYQACKNIYEVVKRYMEESSADETVTTNSGINIMLPVQPMLADVCKSVAYAMKKCPNGMYSEIKYDGERVQVHKQGSQFKYFSRSLKPVLHHKVAHFEKYIPEAFPKATDLILDSEILMIDHETGRPLPFGTLGVHKRSAFKNANVCLFVFDCIYYNGEALIDKPLDYRKRVLKENMTEIPNRIVLAELEIIHTPKELCTMIAKVLSLGLEGLVLKDIKSLYEPGKRHWLKVKKDYLHGGVMADTADLIVLGAWYGTGRKAGMKSVFLMGCFDKHTNQFCTVTKVHTGHDDKTLEQLQTELEMEEIGCDYQKIPNWLNCNKSMTPDFIAKDPKKQPVWEITGAEFTQHDVHTADGISIRFPRVTRIRSDKIWETATTLEELKNLFNKSKEGTDFNLLMGITDKAIDKPKHHCSVSKKNNRKRNHSADNIATPSSKIQKTSHEDHNRAAYEEYLINTKIKNPLPNIFKNVHLLLEDGAKETFRKWQRYFVAYGGTIVDSKNWIRATHILHIDNYVTEQSIKCPKYAQHVTIDWIKDTVANNRLQSTTPYIVRWEPKHDLREDIER